MDIDISHYNTGTATVAGTAVTGQGTQWAGAVRKGDLFGTHKGAGVRIAAVSSNTSLTLAYEVPALEQEEEPYEIQFTPYDTGYQKAVRDLLTVMANGNLEALASLIGAADRVPIFTGSGSMALIPKSDLVSGANYDVQVANLTGRAAYNGQAAGFSVLVANTGDGRAAIYTKLTNASADWSAPAYVTGPAITLDVTEVTEVPYGEPPEVTPTPKAGGYDLSFEIPRGMIVEPGTITTLSPGQPAAWDWEPIAGGYRVNLSVPRGLTGDINGVTSFWVSRLGADEDVAAARAGLGLDGYVLRGAPRVFNADDAAVSFDPDVTAIYVEVQAGGGAGGAATITAANVQVAGAGGGGGGGGFKPVFVEGPLEVAAIVVGAGGAPSEAAGGPGGDSSFTMGDVVVSAPGGLGGGVGNAVASFNSRQGGVGGTPTGDGAVNVPGDPGGHSTQVGSSSGLGSSAAIAGNGGRSQLGGGGRAGRAVASNPAMPTFVAGNPGNGYGAGGGGSAVIVGTSANGSDQAEPGGAGAPGVVIIWEFVDG